VKLLGFSVKQGKIHLQSSFLNVVGLGYWLDKDVFAPSRIYLVTFKGYFSLRYMSRRFEQNRESVAATGGNRNNL
jgi:hypothetical protein